MTKSNFKDKRIARNSSINQRRNLSRKSRGNKIKENEKNVDNIKVITELLGCITAIITAFSILFVLLQKYMSFGRCFYFDFDMNYFDFSLSTESKFIFIITFISGALGVTFGVIQNVIWNFLVNNIIKSKKNTKKIVMIKLTVGLFLSLVTLILTYLISKTLIPEINYLKVFFPFTIFINIVIITILRAMDLKSGKAVINAVLITIVSLAILVSWAEMKANYDEAKKQKEFPIIFETQKTYVVISHSKEKYSAYQCLITGGALTIITDTHKYFDIESTRTVPVEFKNVQKANLKPITYDKVEKYLTEEYNSFEPYEIDYFNQNLY